MWWRSVEPGGGGGRVWRHTPSLQKRKYCTIWIILILGILGGSVTPATRAQRCPDSSQIYPCVCNVKKNGLDIICEHTDYNHISKAMENLKGKPVVIFYLKLRHNNLPKLHDYIFMGLEISHLNIHNSSLAVLEHSSLSSLGTKLTQLDISTNKIKIVPSAAFRNLHALLILNMNHNNITVIHDKSFIGLDTLEILLLYENQISKIEPHAFQGLEK